ncbi:MAG: D-alanyl-D-alanine carboxypeptidase, partial [Chitinophagaceae bacterium]|nr:D-alanyl-D-alanine carboxypeptidase [Chitinophagaceae bacterium]
TIPAGEKRFTISAAFPDPQNTFVQLFASALTSKTKIRKIHSEGLPKGVVKYLHTEYSPPLDSIIYWFLKKSINLYGEALVKTIAYQKTGVAATDTGTIIMKRLWKQKGLPETELNILDGSGLSPQNRVTTHAEVFVLQYARQQPWFPGFYNSLPEYNNMKMKSGTIGGVKGFCGYHTSKDGNEYIFSFLVNNYNGPASTLVQKMYKVLDELK